MVLAWLAQVGAFVLAAVEVFVEVAVEVVFVVVIAGLHTRVSLGHTVRLPEEVPMEGCHKLMDHTAHAVVEEVVEAAVAHAGLVGTRQLSSFRSVACSCPIVFVHTQGLHLLFGSLQPGRR
jgi:hypothetical protein